MNPHTIGPRDVVLVEENVKKKEILALVLNTAFPKGLDFPEELFDTTPATSKNIATVKNIATQR